MNGKIAGINLKRGMIAVETNEGIFVLEFLGDYDVEIGDLIAGALDCLGGKSVQISSQLESLDVYIQSVHCTPSNAKCLIA